MFFLHKENARATRHGPKIGLIKRKGARSLDLAFLYLLCHRITKIAEKHAQDYFAGHASSLRPPVWQRG